MKRELLIVFLLVSICCGAQTTKFDEYHPLLWIPPHYTPIDSWKPMEYSPLVSSDPVTMEPFKPLTVPPSLDEMKEFIKITNAIPSLKDKYNLPYSRYIDITAKAIYFSRGPRWKKKELLAFYHDYNVAKKKAFQQDSVQFTIRREQFIRDSLARKKAFLDASRMSRNKYINDSLAYRDNFLQDSMMRRTLFLADSLKKRETFVEDSLYRADYRQKNHYDYVEWSGSHGEPLICYKNGVKVSWKELDTDGRVIKEYKDNKLIHDYHYGVNWEYYYVDDKIERRKDEYEDKEMTLLRSVEWYNEDGRTRKKQYIDGDVYLYTYFSDGGIKTKTIIGSDGKISSKEEILRYSGGQTRETQTSFENGVPIEKYVEDKYSDGTVGHSWRYESRDKGNSWILRSSTDYRGSYESTKYYDRNGQYERTEISY